MLKSEVLHNKELLVTVKVIMAIIFHLLTALEMRTLSTIPSTDVVEELLSLQGRVKRCGMSADHN